MAYKRLIHRISWIKSEGENEWFYIGLGNEFNEYNTSLMLNDFFKSDTIYLILGRNNSKEIPLSSATTEIKQILKDNFDGFNELILSNKEFNKVFEFNQVGVARFGRHSYS